MPFQQRTNTSCYLAIPTRGFTAALSVFRGTPPAKPLDCKIGPTLLARFFATDRHSSSVENLGSPAPFYVVCQVTSSRCPFVLCHNSLPFVICCCSNQFSFGQ